MALGSLLRSNNGPQEPSKWGMKNLQKKHQKKGSLLGRFQAPKGPLWATKRHPKIDFFMTFSTWPPQGSPGRGQGRQMTPQGYQNDTKMSPKWHQNDIRIVPKPCKNDPQHNNAEKQKHKKFQATDHFVRARWREGRRQVDICVQRGQLQNC